MFCGKQGILLRGHQEHGSDPNTNPGNFRGLLEFRIDAVDSVVADHFTSVACNAQYTSPQIQNDLISCIGDWIRIDCDTGTTGSALAEKILQGLRDYCLYISFLQG